MDATSDKELAARTAYPSTGIATSLRRDSLSHYRNSFLRRKRMNPEQLDPLLELFLQAQELAARTAYPSTGIATSLRRDSLSHYRNSFLRHKRMRPEQLDPLLDSFSRKGNYYILDGSFIKGIVH
jgi:hypothetical protein